MNAWHVRLATGLVALTCLWGCSAPLSPAGIACFSVREWTSLQKSCPGAVEPTPIHTPIMLHPKDWARYPVSGKVTLGGVLTAEGRVTDVTVIGVADPRLVGIARPAFETWRYEPAVCNGVRVPVCFTTTITYTLNRDRGRRGR